MPKVKVSFYIAGEDVDLMDLTEKIGLIPSKVRKKTDWPQASIDKGIAQDTWMLETPKEDCKAISIQFDKLQKMLLPKVNDIITLSEKYFLETSVTIVVEMEVGDGSELVLSKDNIAFLALINAEVGFDLYVE